MVWILLLATTLAFAGVVYQALGLARDAVDTPPPGQLIDIGGRRLHVQTAGGCGPTVVFDAGIGASSVSWARVQPRVARFARTISYDRAGLAWSDAAPGSVTARTCANDLYALLSRLELPAPYL